ncbi:MAG: AlpA family phage regulatory protein [Myxococcota bacterium]
MSDRTSTRLLSLKQVIGDQRARPPVEGRVPVSKTTWYQGIKDGLFPRPVKVGPRRVAWREADIDALIARLSREGGEA